MRSDSSAAVRTRARGPNPRGASLPDVVARVAAWGPGALLLGVSLMGVSFLTNPVPDPSFPWATLPESLRLPVTQPRVEHWPVTYTVGLWVVVFTLPLGLLDAYRRYGPRTSLRQSTWLAALPVALTFAFTTYCRFFWPKPTPATWNAPSYTFVCWLYCSTYDPVWSNLAYAVALLGVGAAVLARRKSRYVVPALVAFGVLALPLGVPALVEAYRRKAA